MSVNDHKRLTRCLRYSGRERGGNTTWHDPRETVRSARPQHWHRRDETITTPTQPEKTNRTRDPTGHGAGTADVQRIDVPPGAHWRRRDRCRRRGRWRWRRRERRSSTDDDDIPWTCWWMLSPLDSYTQVISRRRQRLAKGHHILWTTILHETADDIFASSSLHVSSQIPFSPVHIVHNSSTGSPLNTALTANITFRPLHSSQPANLLSA